MTVSSAVRKAGPFAGNNAATTFPFSFKVFGKADIKVLRVSPSGTSTTLTLDSDYSVQLNANQDQQPGGWVSYPISGDPLAFNYELVVLGDLAYDQETDITNSGGFYPQVIEDMSDRSTIQIQQLAEISSRAIVISEAESTSPTLPSAQARANTIVGFDALGGLELYPLSPAVGAGDLKAERWIDGQDYHSGTDNSVPLSRAYGTKANLGTVVMAGAPQDPDTYDLSGDGTRLVFDAIIPAWANAIWCFGGTTLSTQIPPDGSVSTDKLLDGAVTDAKVTSIGAAKIQYQLPGAGTVLRDVDGVLQQGVSLFDFIPLNLQSSILDGSIAGQDLAPYLQAARDWLNAKSFKPKLLAPPGVYLYSVSPNWAIQNASIIALGEARLRYTGTGNAVIIDVGPTLNVDKYNLTMTGFIVEAPSTAGHGVYVRSIHHSKLPFKVEGAGAASAGINVEFAVCTDFGGATVTTNERGGWYSNTPPLIGLRLAKRNTGEQTSYCLFDNCVFEGMVTAGGAGIQLEDTLGNVFVGGTAEGCANGIVTTSAAVQNRFFGMDLEANITRDILEQGQGNEYHGVDGNKLATVAATALFPLFVGGNYQQIELPTGVRSPRFIDVGVNRNGGGGFLIGDDLDVCTAMFRGCFDIQSQKVTPIRQKTLAPPAGPYPATYTYTNSTPNEQMLAMSGATVTSTSITRNGSANSLGLTIGLFPVSPGDQFSMTYSSGTPVVILYSK